MTDERALRQLIKDLLTYCIDMDDEQKDMESYRYEVIRDDVIERARKEALVL